MHKTHNILKIALLAWAGAALVSANAATPYNGAYAPGDFLLGFTVTTGLGAGTDVLVDLGSINNFAASAQLNTSTQAAQLASVLSTTFGSNWFTNPNLYFSAIAQAQSGDSNQKTVYAAGSSTVWPTISNANATQLTGKVNSEGSATAYVLGTNPPASAPAVTQPITTANTYGAFQPSTQGGTQSGTNLSYSYFANYQVSNPSVSVLTVEQLVPNTATLLLGGTISIDSSGDVFYAIPEPSTVVLVALGALVLGIFPARRRRAKN